jgi:hypothetical protein
LVFWEDDCAAVTTFFECFEDIGDIVFLMAIGLDDAGILATFDHNRIGSTSQCKPQGEHDGIKIQQAHGEKVCLRSSAQCGFSTL